MKSFLHFLLLIVYLVVQVQGVDLRDPRSGFTALPLNSSNFEIQRPYKLAVGSRYKFIDGVHKFWVLSTDVPHEPWSHTKSRTEVRIQGYDYQSGVWQFEGHVYIPEGTTGTSIMQIKDINFNATTLMLRVYNGALMHYPNAQIIADDVYGKWIQVNVIHYATEGKIKVFLNRHLKLVEKDHGVGGAHYFKFGVYTQNYSSYFMESFWKGVKVMKLLD